MNLCHRLAHRAAKRENNKATIGKEVVGFFSNYFEEHAIELENEFEGFCNSHLYENHMDFDITWTRSGEYDDLVSFSVGPYHSKRFVVHGDPLEENREETKKICNKAIEKLADLWEDILRTRYGFTKIKRYGCGPYQKITVQAWWQQETKAIIENGENYVDPNPLFVIHSRWVKKENIFDADPVWQCPVCKRVTKEKENVCHWCETVMDL